ncbi:MAG: hypothetical protein ACYC6M_14055 [Terriglobales bacterium]
MAHGIRVRETTQYVSLSRARWLIAGGRARMTPGGELHLLSGEVHGYDPRERVNPAALGPPARWTPVSAGHVMNGMLLG